MPATSAIQAAIIYSEFHLYLISSFFFYVSLSCLMVSFVLHTMVNSRLLFADGNYCIGFQDCFLYTIFWIGKVRCARGFCLAFSGILIPLVSCIGTAVICRLIPVMAVKVWREGHWSRFSELKQDLAGKKMKNLTQKQDTLFTFSFSSFTRFLPAVASSLSLESISEYLSSGLLLSRPPALVAYLPHSVAAQSPILGLG